MAKSSGDCPPRTLYSKEYHCICNQNRGGDLASLLDEASAGRLLTFRRSEHNRIMDDKHTLFYGGTEP